MYFLIYHANFSFYFMKLVIYIYIVIPVPHFLQNFRTPYPYSYPVRVPYPYSCNIELHAVLRLLNFSQKSKKPTCSAHFKCYHNILTVLLYFKISYVQLFIEVMLMLKYTHQLHFFFFNSNFC